MNMQPVVLVRKLTRNEIDFYTQSQSQSQAQSQSQLQAQSQSQLQAHRSNRSHEFIKKKKSRNLRYKEHVYFKYFEDHCHSQSAYPKRKNHGKKTKSEQSKRGKKPANVVVAKKVVSTASNLFRNFVRGDNPAKVKMTNTRQPRKRKNRKNPSLKAKKFKRMVIESDSDSSEENYGIVYCLDERNVQFPDTNCIPQSSFPSSSLLCNNSMPANVSCSHNISPSCAKGIVNENDILFVLGCDADDEFDRNVINDALSELNCYENLDSNELFNYLYESCRNLNVSANDPQLYKTSVKNNSVLSVLANINNRQISQNFASKKELQQKVDVSNQLLLKEMEKTKPDSNTEIIVNDKNVSSQIDKNGFTLKRIEKGLVLMTFPDPDKELDMSSDSCDEDDRNASSEMNETKKRDVNEQFSQVEKNVKCANHSSESSPQDHQKEESKSSDAITLVLHELDAIAIISLLDLDGDKKHASNLLSNLIKKEISNLKQLCQKLSDSNLKDIAASKSRAKLDRTKSLLISKALIEKYGNLSDIVDVILCQSPSKESLHSTTTSATATSNNLDGKSDQLLSSIHRTTKPEKYPTLSDCVLTKSSNMEYITTDFQTNPSILQDQANSIQTYLFNTEDPKSSESAVVKVKMPRTSSSYMLSDLLTGAQAANNEKYTNEEFTSNTTISPSLINMPTSPFILSNLTGTEIYSSQATQGSCKPSFNMRFNPATLPISTIASMGSVPVSSVPHSAQQQHPVNIKGENESTLSSCQLQINYQSRDISNNCAASLPQVQPKIALPLDTGLPRGPSVTMSCRTILPTSNMLKPMDVTYPFRIMPLASTVLQSMNMKRNSVSLNCEGNSGTSVTNNNIIQSQLSLNAPSLQVVLSNVQPPAALRTPSFFPLTHRNFLAWQPDTNQGMSSSIQNVYKLHSTMPQHSQVIRMPAVASSPQGSRKVYQITKTYWNQKHKPKCKLQV